MKSLLPFVLTAGLLLAFSGSASAQCYGGGYYGGSYYGGGYHGGGYYGGGYYGGGYYGGGYYGPSVSIGIGYGPVYRGARRGFRGCW